MASGYPSSGPASLGLGGLGSGGTHGPNNRISIELDGLPQFLVRFKQYKAGVLMAEPHVRDSIHVRKAGDGAEVYVNRGGVRDEVPAYLEFGTYKMAARPFLKPAGRAVIEAYGVKKAARQMGGLLKPRGLLFEG